MAGDPPDPNQVPGVIYMSKVCPQCGYLATIKESREGRKFIGCTGFPSCRWTTHYDAAIDALARRIMELEATQSEVVHPPGPQPPRSIRRPRPSHLQLVEVSDDET